MKKIALAVLIAVFFAVCFCQKDGLAWELKKKTYSLDTAYPAQELKKIPSDKIIVANTDSEGCRAVWFNCSCLKPGDSGEHTFGFGTSGHDLGQCVSINWLNWHYINNPREACAERWNPADPSAAIYQEDVKCNVCWQCLEYCTVKEVVK